MIVSHKYRFIFLRTEKTGGTSVTRALWNVLGEDDLRLTRGRPWWAAISPIHHGALQRHVPDVFGLHAHATAAQMRRVIGRDVFDSYYKFAIERNPWDRQVSLYHHRAHKRGRAAHFDRDMRSWLYRMTEHCRLDNWSNYAIGGRIVADRVLRYETLERDLAEVVAHLGIAEPVTLGRFRTYAPGRPHYSSYYGAETRDLIGRWYAREIDAFGYRFEQGADAQAPLAGSGQQGLCRAAA